LFCDIALPALNHHWSAFLWWRGETLQHRSAYRWSVTPGMILGTGYRTCHYSGAEPVRARDQGAGRDRWEQTIAVVEAAETRMISVQLKVEGPTLDNGRGTQTAGVAPSRLDYL
jgi:hypothetical protein